MNNEERTRCEVFTRVSGYLRPISQFNEGKKSEARDRLNYKYETDIKEDKQED